MDPLLDAAVYRLLTHPILPNRKHGVRTPGRQQAGGEVMDFPCRTGAVRSLSRASRKIPCPRRHIHIGVLGLRAAGESQYLAAGLRDRRIKVFELGTLHAAGKSYRVRATQGKWWRGAVLRRACSGSHARLMTRSRHGVRKALPRQGKALARFAQGRLLRGLRFAGKLSEPNWAGTREVGAAEKPRPISMGIVGVRNHDPYRRA